MDRKEGITRRRRHREGVKRGGQERGRERDHYGSRKAAEEGDKKTEGEEEGRSTERAKGKKMRIRRGEE